MPYHFDRTFYKVGHETVVGRQQTGSRSVLKTSMSVLSVFYKPGELLIVTMLAWLKAPTP